MSKYISYAQAGVDIVAGDDAVDQMRAYVKSTHGPRVIENEDGFAGLFQLDYTEKILKKNYRNPVLVGCTDGVGSKVQVASMMHKYDTVGIDLVAMNVNDMLVQGAEPLFFLDYLAVHKLEPKVIAQMVKGVAAGCRQADCALLGGETAEMPDTYREDDFDMAGFAVGVVEKRKIITGKNIRKGDVILGLASSGLHSNGYALARHVCFKTAKLKVTDTIDELDGRMIGDVLAGTDADLCKVDYETAFALQGKKSCARDGAHYGKRAGRQCPADAASQLRRGDKKGQLAAT